MGVWTGAEQANFQAVLDGFKEREPRRHDQVHLGGRSARRRSSRRRSQGGNPPDHRCVAQPGLMTDFVDEERAQADHVSPADDDHDELRAVGRGSRHRRRHALRLPLQGGQQVDRLVQRRRPSRTPASSRAGDVGRPARGRRDDQGVRRAARTRSAGRTAGRSPTCSRTSTCAQAGPEKYDQLAAHEIPWTDQSVKDALAEMAKVFSDTDNIAGGTDGRARRRTSRRRSSNVFSDAPKAAHGRSRATSSAGVVDDRSSSRRPGYNVFPFPEIGDSAQVGRGRRRHGRHVQGQPGGAGAREVPGDARGCRRSGPRRAASRRSNKSVERAVYPDEITQTTAGALAEAETFRFDMSDLQPAEFGGTVGQGMWKLLQDFLQEPERRRRDGDRSSRRRQRRRTSSAWRRAEPDAGEPGGVPPGGAPASRLRPAGGAATGSARRSSSLPALVFLLVVWIVYPTIYTIIRSFFDRTGRRVRRHRQLQRRCSRTTLLLTAIKNNAIWVADRAGARDRRSACIFAVLTERVSWSVAFKTAVFMPMAIIAVRGRHHLADHVPQGSRPGRAQRRRSRPSRTPSAHRACSADAQPSTRRPARARRRAGSRSRSRSRRRRGAARADRHTAARGPRRRRAGASQPEPREGGITGVVWRDFKPGGGEPGEVEQDELGPARRDACDSQGRVREQGRLRRRRAHRRHVRLRGRRGGRVTASAISSQTFAEPFEGVAWLGEELITPVDHHRLHLDLGRLRDGRDRAPGCPRSRATCSRRLAPTARTEWQVFRRVTVPLLAPGADGRLHHDADQRLKVFDIVLSVAPGSVQDDATVLALAMWRHGVRRRRTTSASAPRSPCSSSCS